MTYLIILLLIFYLSNSFIDAIDHHRGSETLGFVWHFFKWVICLPSLFLAGVSLVSSNPFYTMGIFFLLYYPAIIIVWIIFHFIWRLHYKFWRWYFKKYGIPKYFYRSHNEAS